MSRIESQIVATKYGMYHRTAWTGGDGNWERYATSTMLQEQLEFSALSDWFYAEQISHCRGESNTTEEQREMFRNSANLEALATLRTHDGGVTLRLPSGGTFDVDVKLSDSLGRTFDRFYAAQDATKGPGWYIFGRNKEYADGLVMCVARPNVKPRKHPHYNVKVRKGFPTKRVAAAVAAHLSHLATLAEFPGLAKHDAWQPAI